MKKHLLPFKPLIIACLAMVTGGGISVAQGTYEKVTDVSSLEAGASVIIVNEKSNVALSTNQKTNNRGQVKITINNGVITPSSEVAILTLGGNDKDGWSFYDAANNGYLYAASNSDNYLKTQTTNNKNGRADITFSSGNATIKFYKDSQCIESEYLLTGDKIQVNFCLYKHASRFKYRDKFKTVEENDFLTEILLDLTYKLEIQTISHHNN